MKYLSLNPDDVKALLDSMESNDHCTIAYDAQIQELRQQIETFAAGGSLVLFRHPARGELTALDALPIEVRALVEAVELMRDGWAEAALPGHNRMSERQQELWRAVHEACDNVWARVDEADA
ncbi:hypothetical protein [Nonomuraea rubra]|uniref:Uncharacterized protein n=1 Tax=Nonomuraea rubra TaxID=46180 RepID=A0A7X0P6I8_9ACTN|nr:hypothetical protein [Nonomuraea rubra]MBB6556181.1 hypothetical protein [Nonomuraea rubra]